MKKKTRSAVFFCAGRIDVIANFAVITNKEGSLYTNIHNNKQKDSDFLSNDILSAGLHADQAVPNSSSARGEIFSTLNDGVPLHTAFYYQRPIVLIWLTYC